MRGKGGPPTPDISGHLTKQEIDINPDAAPKSNLNHPNKICEFLFGRLPVEIESNMEKRA